MTTLEDLQLNGLAIDTMHAEYNFQIFKKIKLIWDKLDQLDRKDKQLFNHLKNSAKEKAVLDLCRLYDKKNSRYPTRCIDEIVQLLISIDEPISQNILTLPTWEKFKVKYDLVIKSFGLDFELQPENYISNLDKLLKKEKAIGEKTILNRLKNWRDKRLAHNENTEERYSLELSEVEFLIQIPKSLLDFLNDFVSTGIHIIYGDADLETSFIDSLIEKYGMSEGNFDE